MKIHIIGASGSGKTYFSQRLAEKYGIPAYELDELFWDNSESGYNVKRGEAERDRILHDIAAGENWVIEGVQHAWVGESFQRADVIYCLETSPMLCRVRIVKRFFARKLRHSSRKNETMQSLLRLLKWTDKFYKINFPEIRKKLEQYEEKVVFLKGNSQINKVLNEKRSG